MFRMQNNIIGDQIKLARREQNLTQNDLAARLQIVGLKHTRNTIAKIETGVRQITDIEIKMFAEVLGVSVGWLFGENLDGNS